MTPKIFLCFYNLARVYLFQKNQLSQLHFDAEPCFNYLFSLQFHWPRKEKKTLMKLMKVFNVKSMVRNTPGKYR